MRVTIELKPERDGEVLAWLSQQTNRSEAIREALRAYVARSGVTLGQVLEAVEALGRQLESVHVEQSVWQSDIQGDAPGTDAAAESLSKLGRW